VIWLFAKPKKKFYKTVLSCTMGAAELEKNQNSAAAAAAVSLIISVSFAWYKK
jgi:hypothetical protein